MIYRNNNRFRFKDNEVKESRMSESMTMSLHWSFPGLVTVATVWNVPVAVKDRSGAVAARDKKRCVHGNRCWALNLMQVEEVGRRSHSLLSITYLLYAIFFLLLSLHEVVNLIIRNKAKNVRLEDFTAVTMKNAVFWDVTPCRSLNRRFGRIHRLHLYGRNIRERGTSVSNLQAPAHAHRQDLTWYWMQIVVLDKD
jgi:hypothetical protein